MLPSSGRGSLLALGLTLAFVRLLRRLLGLGFLVHAPPATRYYKFSDPSSLIKLSRVKTKTRNANGVLQNGQQVRWHLHVLSGEPSQRVVGQGRLLQLRRLDELDHFLQRKPHADAELAELHDGLRLLQGCITDETGNLRLSLCSLICCLSWSVFSSFLVWSRSPFLFFISLFSTTQNEPFWPQAKDPAIR